MAADPCRGTYSHTSWKARIRTRRGNTDAPSVRTRSRRRRSQRTGADAGGGRDARTLPTDRQSYSHDERHERARWPRVAQPRRLKAPESNRRHRSKVDVLAHAAKEANVLHVAAIINEDFGDLNSVEAGQIDPGKIRCDVKDLLRRIGVAADTACRRCGDVARGRRAYGHRRLRRSMRPLAAPAYDRERQTRAAPQILTHAVLGHRNAYGWPSFDPADLSRELTERDSRRHRFLDRLNFRLNANAQARWLEQAFPDGLVSKHQ
jgi:hypothetical protein